MILNTILSAVAVAVAVLGRSIMASGESTLQHEHGVLRRRNRDNAHSSNNNIKHRMMTRRLSKPSDRVIVESGQGMVSVYSIALSSQVHDAL